MARVDYYSFAVYEPYKFGGEYYRTLSEAKKAYKEHLRKGHRINHTIYGCTNQEDGVFLTFTPWYSDSKEFGRTQLTSIGKAVNNGTYILGYGIKAIKKVINIKQKEML